jgi:hypothetical protein
VVEKIEPESTQGASEKIEGIGVVIEFIKQSTTIDAVW